PDSVAFTLIIQVLKQLISRQVATVFDNAGETPVVDVGLVVPTAFPAKADVDTAALDGGMSVAQSCQAEALVRLGILAVADTEERQFHQADNGREDPLTLQARYFEILLHSCSKLRQYTSKNQ